jgi:hypothetical protein
MMRISLKLMIYWIISVASRIRRVDPCVAIVVVALAAPVSMLHAESLIHEYEFRFVGDAEIPKTLDESSIPAEYLLPLPDVELISISALEAPNPRSTFEGRTLEFVDTIELVGKLDVDRLLLSEIRKPVPNMRSEAEIYLFRLKNLAGRSDPVRLVPLVDRLLDQAPIYFDWLDREFENQDEELMEYYVGGARGFSFALENFKNAVMFAIINRLDVASRVIYELETTR